MISPETIPAHSPKVVVRRINNESLLIPLTDNIADMDSLYRLNDTGAFIWESIDGKRNIRDLVDMLVEEFEVERNEAEKDILLFLTETMAFLDFSNSDY